MNAAPRAESAPRFWVERWDEATGTFAYGLGLAGQRGESVDGRWVREIPVEAGSHYAFRAEYRAKNVAEPVRSILARVI
jgi:hypothetical protein